MPARDGTGPTGKGSMTGRGLGNCNPNNVGKNRTFFGRGNRRGRKLGQGFGRGYNAYPIETKESLEDEKKVLEDRIKYINSQLDN